MYLILRLQTCSYKEKHNKSLNIDFDNSFNAQSLLLSCDHKVHQIFQSKCHTFEDLERIEEEDGNEAFIDEDFDWKARDILA